MVWYDKSNYECDIGYNHWFIHADVACDGA